MISPLSQDMTSPITSPTGSGDIEIPMSELFYCPPIICFQPGLILKDSLDDD